MNIKSKVIWITRTAVFIALLVVLQTLTASLGNTIITGSVVNMMLIVSVMTCEIATGLSVAVVSPIIAKLVGIGPFWSLIPFIIAGNTVLVFIWHYIGNRKPVRNQPVDKHEDGRSRERFFPDKETVLNHSIDQNKPLQAQKASSVQSPFVFILALICAAVSKFLVLYIGIVRIAIPIFLDLPEQQAAVISNMFSVPQLITAIIGGIMALVLLPTLKKAIGGRE